MEKETGVIKITETDDGYRIDIKGKNLKDAFGCCLPLVIDKDGKLTDCCTTDAKNIIVQCGSDESKMAECCPPGSKKIIIRCSSDESQKSDGCPPEKKS